MKEILQSLASGDLIMMPQNFYAEAYKLGSDKFGNECIVAHPSNEKLEDYEMLAMLIDNDVLKWTVTEEEFPAHTVQAFCEYYMDDGDCEYEGPQATDCTCKRCGGHNVVKEDELDYPYYCIECDENMYSFEVSGCPPKKDTWKCATYLADASDTDNAFFDIECPDDSGNTLELNVSVVTNKTELAWLSVEVEAHSKGVYSREIYIGEWSEKLELAHTIGREYITVEVKGSDKRATLQVKVQKDEPGIILDLFKYEPDDPEEAITEELGYLIMEDCDAEQDNKG